MTHSSICIEQENKQGDVVIAMSGLKIVRS
jgi:hypothetical protein